MATEKLREAWRKAQSRVPAERKRATQRAFYERHRDRVLSEKKPNWTKFRKMRAEKLKVLYAQGDEVELTKKKARSIFSWAKRSGKVVKMPCEKCGNIKAEGHHDDYNKPLDVRWLCRKHHSEHHRKT